MTTPLQRELSDRAQIDGRTPGLGPRLADRAWSRGRRRRRARAAALLTMVCLVVCLVVLGLGFGYLRGPVSVARQPQDGGAGTYPQRVEHPYVLSSTPLPTGPVTAVVSAYDTPLDALAEGYGHTALLFPDGRIRRIDALDSAHASLSPDGRELAIYDYGQTLNTTSTAGRTRLATLDLSTGQRWTHELRAPDGAALFLARGGDVATWAPGSERAVTTACREREGPTCATPYAVVLEPGGRTVTLDVGGYAVGWADPATLVVTDRPPGYWLDRPTLGDGKPVTVRLVDAATPVAPDAPVARTTRRFVASLPTAPGHVPPRLSVSPSGRLLSVEIRDDTSGSRSVSTVDLQTGSVAPVGTYAAPEETGGLWRGDDPAYWTPSGLRLVADGTPLVVADAAADIRVQSWAADALSGPPVTHPLGLVDAPLLWRWRELGLATLLVGVGWFLRRRFLRHRRRLRHRRARSPLPQEQPPPQA